jgi:hypothetical protein
MVASVRRRFSVLSLAPVAVFLLAAPACGDDDPPPAGPSACVPAPPPQKLAGACEVTIELPPLQAQNSQHVKDGTDVPYCSNPPSSGPHYPLWADFKEYPGPVPSGYLVHSMEHGAVVLFYKCDPPGCPDIVEGLRKMRDVAPVDPRCTDGVKRIIVVPSTTIASKVAAAAWGATYQAPCLDTPSLEAFVRDHYAKGPEDICAPGIPNF